MNLKQKFAAIAGSAIVASSLVITSAALAATEGTTPAPAATESAAAAPSATDTARPDKFDLDQAVADGTITQAEADVLQQLNDLRQATMEKLQTESQAIVDQAVTDGKITQEQADALLTRGGHHGFGGKGFGLRGMTQEELKAKLDEKVAAGELTQEEADAILSGEGRMGHGQKGFRNQDASSDLGTETN